MTNSENKMTKDILEEALSITQGDRRESYGHPLQDFERVSHMATGLIKHKLKDGQSLDADDIWRLMICIKLSRDVYKPKRDNKVDIAGYARCGQLVAENKR